jgi:hypothetical protein
MSHSTSEHEREMGGLPISLLRMLAATSLALLQVVQLLLLARVDLVLQFRYSQLGGTEVNNCDPQELTEPEGAR